MKTINEVPESITRADYLALMAAVGFEPKRLKSLRFEPFGIYAEVYHRNDDGKQVLDGPRGVPAIHQIYIPVKD